MCVADSSIVNSIIQLTNHFGEEFTPPQDNIATLSELWQKHGTMIAHVLRCERVDFKSSDMFYEILYRKFRHNAGEFAAALDPAKAAAGDTFEICKFYVHFLENLRSENSEMITQVLESLAAKKGLDSQPLLEIFAYLDKLYSENSLDDWWACLRGEETDVLESLRTPRRNQHDQFGFTTPTASARRFRTAASSARSHRSPIADAVDSPTMKFMRTERELKTAKQKMSEMQGTLDDMDSENEKLVKRNRELKLMIDELKGNASNNRESVENATRCAEEMSSELIAKRQEVEKLLKELDEHRNHYKTKERQLNQMEEEKEKLESKLDLFNRDRDLFMKQLKELRISNEEEFAVWKQKEKSLSEELRTALQEKAYMNEQLSALEEMKRGLCTENERLSQLNQQLEMESSIHKQKADDTIDALQELRSTHNEKVARMREEHTERFKMLEMSKERLEKELDDERKERKSLGDLLNDLNEKALANDKSNHEQAEGFLSAKACLEAAKQRIEHLELEIRSKDIRIQIEKNHATDLMNSLANNVQIREQWVVQQQERMVIHENEKEKLLSELESAKAELEIAQRAAQDKDIEITNKVEAIALLTKEMEVLQMKVAEEKHVDHLIDDKVVKDPFLFPWRRLRSESIEVEIAKVIPETGEELDILSNSLVAPMPIPKAVSFQISSESDTTIRENPLGFRSEPRQSICSITEDMFDRSSNARSSIRSDMTINSVTGTFKEPFTPCPTTKERLGVLKARNEQVAPHLKSAYASETQDVSSPSGNEENIRSAKKKRRQSIVSMKSFKSVIGLGKKDHKEDEN